MSEYRWTGWGRWLVLLGSQARVLPQMTADEQLVYTLGLKLGFFMGPNWDRAACNSARSAKSAKDRFSQARRQKGERGRWFFAAL